MNVMTGQTAFDRSGNDRAELEALVDIAAQTIAPLWPLDSAIAVNPLAGFEDRAFETAVTEAAGLFGARSTLPLRDWRTLLAEGRIDPVELRKAAVAALGGLDRAFTLLGPDLNAYDLLLARLMRLPVSKERGERRTLAPALAVLARWLAAYFDPGAALRLPDRHHGLYRCVLGALRHDPAVRRLADAASAVLLERIPSDPLDALGILMRRDRIDADGRLDWLRGLYARLPGWSGHIRWRTLHAAPALRQTAPAAMVELAALVALVESVAPSARRGAVPVHDAQATGYAMLAHLGMPADAPEHWPAEGRALFHDVASMDEARLGLIFQDAAERSYLAGLLPRLGTPLDAKAAPASRPDAQLVFCIDVRSEPMRRSLEAAGAFETLGYAGFFGLPIALRPACEAPARNQLPVLLSPAHEIDERPAPGREAEAGALLARHASLRDAQRMLDTTKSGATGFATAEAAGPLAAVALLARTLAPRFTDRVRQRIVGQRAHLLAPAACNDHSHDGGIGLAEKIGYAKGMFALTGLGARTARLVALVGHGGCTTNNAFAASLDCGACGGHPGGPNARLMAAILNDPQVRAGLAAEGLELPDDSWFIAAQHDTTRDIVEIFDRGLVPASHADDLGRLERALAAAGAQCREERALRLGRPAEDLLTGAAHWGEVRPEWGLSGNAAFIAAPREMTRGVDLGGTAFLHSYDWRKDDDGSALATILTAPMIVAQWINCQYLFSTVDNDVFGAGDKTTQNVVGGFAVVQGGGGDLCVGLPRQSLFRDDGVPFHTPRRLAVVVHAPLQRVQDIVLRHDAVGRLVDNGWINLIVIDPWRNRTHHWLRGAWVARSC